MSVLIENLRKIESLVNEFGIDDSGIIAATAWVCNTPDILLEPKTAKQIFAKAGVKPLPLLPVVPMEQNIFQGIVSGVDVRFIETNPAFVEV